MNIESKLNQKRKFLCDLTGMSFEYMIVSTYLDNCYHVHFFDDTSDRNYKIKLLEEAFGIHILRDT